MPEWIRWQSASALSHCRPCRLTGRAWRSSILTSCMPGWVPGRALRQTRWANMSDELSATGDEKAWKLLEKTLQASVIEQRRARRWGIFFKLLVFVYLFGTL